MYLQDMQLAKSRVEILYRLLKCHQFYSDTTLVVVPVAYK